VVFEIFLRLQHRRRMRARRERGRSNHKRGRGEDGTQVVAEPAPPPSSWMPRAGQCESPDGGGAGNGVPVFGSR
jgi:hypothetical protein